MQCNCVLTNVTSCWYNCSIIVHNCVVLHNWIIGAFLLNLLIVYKINWLHNYTTGKFNEKLSLALKTELSEPGMRVIWSLYFFSLLTKSNQELVPKERVRDPECWHRDKWDTVTMWMALGALQVSSIWTKKRGKNTCSYWHSEKKKQQFLKQISQFEQS